MGTIFRKILRGTDPAVLVSGARSCLSTLAFFGIVALPLAVASLCVQSESIPPFNSHDAAELPWQWAASDIPHCESLTQVFRAAPDDIYFQCRSLTPYYTFYVNARTRHTQGTLPTGSPSAATDDSTVHGTHVRGLGRTSGHCYPGFENALWVGTGAAAKVLVIAYRRPTPTDTVGDEDCGEAPRTYKLGYDTVWPMFLPLGGADWLLLDREHGNVIRFTGNWVTNSPLWDKSYRILTESQTSAFGNLVTGSQLTDLIELDLYLKRIMERE
jgi:hypothetical protein